VLAEALLPSPSLLIMDGATVINANAGTSRTSQHGLTIGAQQSGSQKFRGHIGLLRVIEGALRP
jgi:hypothetical protein